MGIGDHFWMILEANVLDEFYLVYWIWGSCYPVSWFSLLGDKSDFIPVKCDQNFVIMHVICTYPNCNTYDKIFFIYPTKFINTTIENL